MLQWGTLLKKKFYIPQCPVFNMVLFRRFLFLFYSFILSLSMCIHIETDSLGGIACGIKNKCKTIVIKPQLQKHSNKNATISFFIADFYDTKNSFYMEFCLIWLGRCLGVYMLCSYMVWQTFLNFVSHFMLLFVINVPPCHHFVIYLYLYLYRRERDTYFLVISFIT